MVDKSFINSDEFDEEHLGETHGDVEASDIFIVAREVERRVFLYKNADQNFYKCD